VPPSIWKYPKYDLGRVEPGISNVNSTLV